ncbi:unnamed protein product [Linum trigynum]|uniref:Uncharacterized protein n=1 Tax=Linum trigynum TaxID=586398 RepID=A0AAV2CU65_9ROSI
METLPRRNLSPRRNHHPSGLRYDSSTTIGGPSHPSAILRLHATVYHHIDIVNHVNVFVAYCVYHFSGRSITAVVDLSLQCQSSEFLEKLWSGVGCMLGKTNRTEQGVEHILDYKRERLGSLQNGAMTMKIFMVHQLLMSNFNES